MTELSREGCIELGLSVPTVPLVVWANEQLSVAKGRQERLQDRGITAPFLKEIKTLIGAVSDRENALGKEKASLPPEVAQIQRLREEALAYWQEAKQIVKIEFGTCPEVQAKCRLGVRTGRLLANLCRELECVVAMLCEHSPQLGWLGVDGAFISAGEGLVGKLREAQARLDSASKALSPTLAEQCCEKGKLDDLCRKLVRIGQLEYLHEPEQAAAFNYSLLRRELRAGSEIRAKTTKAVAR
jgi:hypothetical protein